MTVPSPDVAYYYPAPYWGWNESGWVKSLLLFFDQVAILLPDYMHGRHAAGDPSLVEPLEELGILRVLEPSLWVTDEVASELATVIVDLMTNGAFDDLDRGQYFQELSQSRIGYGADVGLAKMLVDELVAMDLARPSEDGVSIPLHPVVRTTILVVLAQLARSAGPAHDMTIHPATSQPQAVHDLLRTLSLPELPSAHRVVSLDLEPVALDLDLVPLDEVLAFRQERSGAHRAYVRDLQRFLSEVSAVEEAPDREVLLIERQQEISDAAHDLQRVTRQAFAKNLASWSLGIAGATWSATTGDPIGVALTTAGVVFPQLIPAGDPTVSAYSFLFAARKEFGRT